MYELPAASIICGYYALPKIKTNIKGRIKNSYIYY